MTRANTPALVGDVAVATNLDNAELYLSDLVYRLKLHDYDADLASAALRTSMTRQLIGVIARGTSGSMPKLRGEDLLALPVPALSRGQQRAIGIEDVAQRKQRNSRLQDLHNSIKMLTEYKSSLITAAVTGEIDVTASGTRISA